MKGNDKEEEELIEILAQNCRNERKVLMSITIIVLFGAQTRTDQFR